MVFEKFCITTRTKKKDLNSSFYRALARKNLSVKACRLCQLP